ncbi:MAG TPA: hypothetical protein ENI33_05420 [Thermoplasmatales archaeon]|nr:hypothetical protein [Thermoplasmatales archaeon]
MKGKILFVIAMLLIPSINAQLKPDIYISDASIYPEEIYEGDEVKISITVGNLGEEANDIEIALFVDNRTEAVDEITISKLGYNEVKQVNLYWFAEEGEHTLFIFADPNAKIDEESEDNNIFSMEVNVKKPVYPPFPPPSFNATWWDSKWHYRVPLAVSMTGERENFSFANKMVYYNINFTSLMEKISYTQAGSFLQRTFYPDSVRVVEYELQNNTWIPIRNVGREVILSGDYDALKNANVTIKWVMEDEISPHERRFYYIYWDTVENGYKEGEFGRIYSGIKNCEFEDKHSTYWKNVSEGQVNWKIEYVEDPIEHDQCYKIYSKGFLGQFGYVWLPGYIKVYQNFRIPDEGKTYYILHGKVYLYSDLDGVQWQILMDGEAIETGVSTDGWIEISKNITSYLKNKNYATLSFRIDITQSYFSMEKKEVYAYIDSFWIETPNIYVDLFENSTHGWWGNVYGIENEYIAGVDGKDTIESIYVESVANPKEVIAKLYSPKSKLVRVSMPLPDPSFEEEEYTFLFNSDIQTASSSIQERVYHTGDKAVELRLNNYEGKWEFQNEEVKEGDMAGFRQNITSGISLSILPELYFWYNIEKFSQYSYLNYTLITIGSSPRFHTIHLADLKTDGEWHRYNISEKILNNWRKGGGKVIAFEIRLIAGADSAESTIYIDDLGYSFMPENSTDRTKWRIGNFYQFTGGEQTGRWRMSVIISDGSDYRIEKGIEINVDAAANLDVFRVDVPSGLKEGENGKFTVNIKNHGPKSVDENTPINVTLAIYQEDGEYIKMRKSLAGLEKDETKKVEFGWLASYGKENHKGRWKVIARVNEKGEIPEWEMKDNWYATEVTVEPMPDLKIDMEDVAFIPSHPSKNETFNISIIVHNIGYANTSAHIRILKKKIDEEKFVLITSEDIERFIEGKSWEKIVYPWKAENGTYNIKVEVECDEEKNLNNNFVIKDVKIGGNLDLSSPIITGIRVNPELQSMGNRINISATIYDEDTTIDRATVVVFNGSEEKSYCMKRLFSTDIYYINTSFNEIGYYTFFIQAWDTATIENMAKSEEKTFRIIYEGIETNPPEIRGVSIIPASGRQVLFEKINISVYVEDETGIDSVTLFIENGETEENEMKGGENNIYYFERKCEKTGKFRYYIKAVDSSANKNYNLSSIYYFEVPVDYDFDDVPDIVEINLGANPKNANETVNVSLDSETGYLLWIEKDNKYVYWDKDDNESRETGRIDVDGDGEYDILFDVDGDGEYDYYYSKEAKEIRIYKKEEKKEITETVWILPPTALFILICIGFLFVRKK